MRKPSLLTCGLALATAVAVVACSEPPVDQQLPRGGWDGNSGNYSGNLGSFGTVSGLPGIPDWAPDPTGAGTVNNATVYGLKFNPSPIGAPCARATSGITDVRFLSSSGDSSAAIGPDVEVVHTGGASERLALGDTIVFPGQLFDGYMHGIEVMYELQRVDTLVYRNAPGYQWPVFALRLCESSHAGDLDDPHWKHMGFVSWAPFVRLPEVDGQPFDFRDDLVQAVTVIPRAEYHDNPNVPQVVAAQTGALVFKFAFFSGAPVALHHEAALDLRSSLGAVLTNAEFIFRGGMALGDASWVTLSATEDPLQHKFLSFFTRDGTEVALFSLARGNGSSAAAIHLPPSWGGQVLAPLELTDDERTSDAAYSLDNVQSMVSTSLVAGQRIAAIPTHEGSGLSTYRAGLYLNSPNNRKYKFFGQLRANINATRLNGIIGRIPSQVALENDMRSPATPIAFLVAAESPLPEGTQPFEQPTNVDPPPPGAPVIPPDADAGVDAADAMTDAMTDGMIDGAMIDARPDAGIDAGADAADAAPDAGTDAGIDAPDAAPDAGMDASIDAPDAAPDAGMDASIDAPDAGSDAGSTTDANQSCFPACDDAGGPG